MALPQSLSGVRITGALANDRGREIPRFYHPDEMVCKVQCRMQLDIWHMTADAVSCPSAARMKCLAIMAGMAFRIVKIRIVSARVLMRHVARRASQFAARKTPTLHQAQRLKT